MAENETSNQHAGRVAVVTGSSKGIGAAIAVELAARGHRVVINYLSSAQEAAAVVEQIEAAGGTAVAHRADVCDAEQARGLVARAVEEFGALDVLVCNANVGLGAGDVASVEWEVFAGKLNAELAAAFHPTQAALPELAKSGAGSIVYLSSDSARGPGAPHLLAHGVSKSALNAYGRFVAKDAAPQGIRVNVLSPGLVRTEATAAIPAEMFQHWLDRIPYGRAAEAQDVARAVAFLASGESEYFVGQVISLNGGSDLGR
ncbi:SDR family NAD(P)-dependent oxidoreductase [Kitasatospora sp. NBC_00315]|uniref:SDR family NAD(P)-dependent oxidoreductase n=1 Tax=Kitasatospora sp. NBC_00315 TaxID=2975963 RepID=UPI00324D7D51